MKIFFLFFMLLCRNYMVKAVSEVGKFSS